MVVLDTCAIIELSKAIPDLSAKTIQRIELGAYLLSISFAEIACKIKLGKLEMSITTKALFDEFSRVQSIKIIDIGVGEWLDSIDLDWTENKDPADRIITAFAKINQCPIVTTDKKIKKFYKKVIW